MQRTKAPWIYFSWMRWDYGYLWKSIPLHTVHWKVLGLFGFFFVEFVLCLLWYVPKVRHRLFLRRWIFSPILCCGGILFLHISFLVGIRSSALFGGEICSLAFSLNDGFCFWPPRYGNCFRFSFPFRRCFCRTVLDVATSEPRMILLTEIVS